MSSPPLLDIEVLLAPVPGDDPAGDSVPYEIREALAEARKHVDPESFPPDDPRRPELKVADWTGIIRMAEETLTARSKDLLVAARLTEALTKEHGFAGTRDGLRLLRRLVAECWDRLKPSIDDGDVEVRATAFNWLDDPNLGARFPNSLRAVPLVATAEKFCCLDWRPPKESLRQAAAPEALERAVAESGREFCQHNVDDLGEAVQEVDLLATGLGARMESAAPALLEVRKALQDCHELARQILERKGPDPDAPAEAAPPEETAAEGEPAAETGDGAAPAERARPARRGGGATREEVYAQLNEAAAALQRMEPHSPIPYLIQKAITLGALPFPQLMRALIRDEGVLNEMNRELGIKEPQPQE